MILRLKVTIKGVVQGVGFRPFIYRLASAMNLSGFVLNSTSGVLIEVEGSKKQLDSFLLKIKEDKPVHAIINSMEFSFLDAIGYKNFEVKKSESNQDKDVLILPDIAVCNDCLEEMFNPQDRRYLYPFINCTNCGPRFSIIERLPYDRPNTSMKEFKMCEECLQEYKDPQNRRFHAQPIACPKCGPHVELWNHEGGMLSSNEKAINETIELLKERKIIALKGLGGFQLLVDAGNEEAVKRMRKRKHREEKPFALMFPSIIDVRDICIVNDFEERLLMSPESPIVLLKKKKTWCERVCDQVALDNPYFGIMLPYTPLHHLILQEYSKPIVATSGNIAEEPMCINESEALQKLNRIADYFLVHNRPIVRHVDDSIGRIVLGRELILRRARGYAPLPIYCGNQSDSAQSERKDTILAVGGHLKNTIAIQKKSNIFISQHIGDLATAEALNTFENVIRDFKELYEVDPSVISADMHPEYLSTKYAREHFSNVNYIQHHEAHIAACRLENEINGNALGVSWDGTGYGRDSTIWGGEFFISGDQKMEHCGRLRTFYLPGGEASIKEPRRTAMGLLYTIFNDYIALDKYKKYLFSFSEKEFITLKRMLNKKINCQVTSSMGRIFDAVASLLNIRHINNYEGQAAMMLEYIADTNEKGYYPFKMDKNIVLEIDWFPIIKKILKEIDQKIPSAIISARFHNTLIKMIYKVTKYFNLKKVILSGGCFQNINLLEKTVYYLREKGIKVYWHQRIPPNDGGIAVGQIALANLENRNKRKE
jgi:hydrogenase maturation protein HypF